MARVRGREMARRVRSSREVAVAAWRDGSADHLALMAAGVAFFAFLALFPTLVALALVYGLVADPADVRRQVTDLVAPLPGAAEDVIVEQTTTIAARSSQQLSLGVAVTLVAALWTASRGISGLVKAVNIASDTEAPRSFVERGALGLVLTLGALAFVLTAVALIAVIPLVAEVVGVGPALSPVLFAGRWLLLGATALLALAVLYWLAPNRDDRRFRWLSPGSITATALWLLASAGFALYVELLGRYNRTYGALGGVAVLLLWLFLTALAVLFGAEIDAARERTRTPRAASGPRPASGPAPGQIRSSDSSIN